MMVSDEQVEIDALLLAIYGQYHHDFRGYSMNSLSRRIHAALTRLRCPSVPALTERVLHDERSFSELLKYLTVQVSDLFRDPSFYLTLRQTVIPVLRTYPSLKIWLAGCSSGEEVYSFAILLQEEGLLDKTLIYATDISAEAISRAESGIYPISRIPTFTENHRNTGAQVSLAEYYHTAYGSAVFDEALRKNVVFADHSLATDSVFAEVNLVSCRNVLIYFTRSLQDRAIGLMAGSLCRRGFLGLGPKETLDFSAHNDLFESVSLTDRWYRRK